VEGLCLGFDLLGDPDPALRSGAAGYLGFLRSPLAIPHLIPLLRDPDATVRRSAAGALGRIGDPRSLPFLERAMADDDAELADAALRAAREIRSRQDASGDPS
jgi:HEAT repeat protein